MENTAKIKELNKNQIYNANMNSFGGKRGDLSERSYMQYAECILSFDIPEAKKQILLDELHKKWSMLLGCEAQSVSVIVAGPARYNRKMDKSDKILQLSSDIHAWFQGIEQQAAQGVITKTEKEVADLIECIEFRKKMGLDPIERLAILANKDNEKFIALFEELQPIYKYRKNSNIYKLYIASKEGKVKNIRPETIFEDENLTAYTEGDRAYIKFTLKPKRQMIVALKSRGWWWNSGKAAWSTYLDRVDKEWIHSISEKYKPYL